MSSIDQDQKLKLIETKDGSQTILNADLGSTYHSRHGALTESKHVFIEQGLGNLVDEATTEITVLEMGFGTGLNALLTCRGAKKQSLSVKYHGLELYPVPESVWRNYQLPAELINLRSEFESMHSAAWNSPLTMDTYFELTKHKVSLLEFDSELSFDLVYFDAFEPETQPELWTEEVFSKLFDKMSPGGILTTYCCKGYVRRNMIAAGFVVEKVPGPPGKREMIVAQRPL
jgi:tRNA U34 5-methylaminomethyl-2-thiouridine-forming methyltransferase MnmC